MIYVVVNGPEYVVFCPTPEAAVRHTEGHPTVGVYKVDPEKVDACITYPPEFGVHKWKKYGQWPKEQNE